MKIFNYEIPKKDLIITLDITLIVITFNIFCLLYKISSVDFIEILHVLLNPILVWIMIPVILLLNLEESLLKIVISPIMLAPFTFIYYLIIYSIFKHFINKIRSAIDTKGKIKYILISIGVLFLIIVFILASVLILLGMALAASGF